MTIQDKIKMKRNSFTGGNMVNDWLQGAYESGIKDCIAFASGNIEDISAVVHEQWMQTKIKQGVYSRKSETGEELMIPYVGLSEAAKDLDRGTVKAVLNALCEIYFPVKESPQTNS